MGSFFTTATLQLPKNQKNFSQVDYMMGYNRLTS